MMINQANVVLAVVILTTSNKNFTPINNNKGTDLLQVPGVPLINDILKSLALGGVGETILFCCDDGPQIKEYIRQCVEEKAEWSLSMDVQVMMSDTCRTMGDVMREIDAAGLIKGHFVLAGVNSITNIPFAALLEQHKQTCEKDKRAAMTLVYKNESWEHPLISSDKPTFLAADARTNKVLMHQKYNPKSSERPISWTMEMVLNHSGVKLHHNLADANIALCSPAVPALFSDNLDFQTRDDFIHGILTNERKLASSLYYILLKGNQYAAAGSIMGNRSLRENTPTLGRSCSLVKDVRSNLMIGNNCVIGRNVKITRSQLMNNVVVNDNCIITDSFIGNNAVINANVVLERANVPPNTVVTAGSHIVGNMLQTSDGNKENTLLKSTSESAEWENEAARMGNHNLREKASTLSRSGSLVVNVLIGSQTIITKSTIITNSVIGANCLIGDNVIITNSILKNNIIVMRGCRFNRSVIDNNCVIHESCVLEGAVLGTDVVVQAGTHMTG